MASICHAQGPTADRTHGRPGEETRELAMTGLRPEERSTLLRALAVARDNMSRAGRIALDRRTAETRMSDDPPQRLRSVPADFRDDEPGSFSSHWCL